MTNFIIILAQKPIKENFAFNCSNYGCGGLNIDECRVDILQDDYKGKGGGGVKDLWQGKMMDDSIYQGGFKRSPPDHTRGRWPANLILDEGIKEKKYFPFTHAPGSNGSMGTKGKGYVGNFGLGPCKQVKTYNDPGSAARFFKSFN